MIYKVYETNKHICNDDSDDSGGYINNEPTMPIEEYLACDICNTNRVTSRYTHIDTCSLCDRDIQLCVACYIHNRHSEIAYSVLCKGCVRDKIIDNVL